MKKPSPANEKEYVELARTLDQLAERAPALDAGKLIALWPGVERRLVARARADEHDATIGLEGPLLQAEGQRIRNLVWEIGVSVDLRAVHLGALRTLATLLRERDQRCGRRRVELSRAEAVPARD